MTFCSNCGEKLQDGSKFCSVCGAPCQHTDTNERKQEFVGIIKKCPNCGEVLKSFELNCPACGYELRETKVSSAVKEFALKLEEIESKREYEKPKGLFTLSVAQQRVSKTDEQKISLIKSFVVPNSKEDMLEFMILATSSMNMRVFDSLYTNVSKSERELNEAWFSKVQQVYEKAKRSYSTDSIIKEIENLYNHCNGKITKSKKKGIMKLVLLFGAFPLMCIMIALPLSIWTSKDEKKEIKRLDNIVIEVQEALGNKEYKHALRIADSIDYQCFDAEQERKWDIEREYWVEKVIEEAANSGIELDYTPTEDIDRTNASKSEESNDEANKGGFVDGFKEGVQPGLDEAQENIDEFNRIMNGEESSKKDKD